MAIKYNKTIKNEQKLNGTFQRICKRIRIYQKTIPRRSLQGHARGVLITLKTKIINPKNTK